nr:MAG TPA: large terminase [Caudoviricetes sp.]
MCRFAYNFEVLSRGYGKTTFELLAIYIMAILYPRTTWSMSAQTLQTSAGFFSDKHADIMQFYPIIAQEIDGKVKITDNAVEICFKNGSVVTNVTNGSNAKGLRRNGITFEEAALMSFTNYRDNTEPLTSEELKSPRYQSVYDPYCRNKQNFVTTAYYKNEAYEFCRQLVIDKANCKETFVYGASYRLPAKFGRGRSIEQVEALVDKVGQLMFNFNYGSRWAVNNGSCIVDIDLLKSLQTLSKPEMKPVKDGEYVVSIDVARSAKTSNNASAIAILKVVRDSKGKVREIQAVNLVKLPNGMNFKDQTVITKKLCKLYNANVLVIDINGLGKGLMDYVLDEQVLDDGEILEALDMINTDYRSGYNNAKRMVYGIEAQSNNSEMITQFINIVETKKLRLLQPFDVNKALDIPDEDYLVSDVLPYLRTENFIAEVQNLTVEAIPSSNKLKIGQLVRADKDIFSAVEMGSWYIMKHCNDSYEEEEEDVISVLRTMVRKPRIR